MKKILSILIAGLTLVSSFTFAQYGSSLGGGSTYGGAGGYTSYSLTRDICTFGDRSPSYFDGSCGDVMGSGNLLLTGPFVKKVKKKRIISFTRLLNIIPVVLGN